jgi:Fe-S-cluster containining protein
MSSEEPDFANNVRRFRCNGCGECCRGDITIWLNLEDLGRMAEFLGYPKTSLLLENGWVSEGSLDAGGFRPFLKFKESCFRFCPFLENRLDENDRLFGDCRLHGEHQPLVCRLSPVGRYWSSNEGSSWFWMLPIEGCPGGMVPDLCSPGEFLEPLQERFRAEERYFHIMEHLQKNRASLEIYRELHWDWSLMHAYDEHLDRFQPRISAASVH